MTFNIIISLSLTSPRIIMLLHTTMTYRIICIYISLVLFCYRVHLPNYMYAVPTRAQVSVYCRPNMFVGLHVLNLIKTRISKVFLFRNIIFHDTFA